MKKENILYRLSILKDSVKNRTRDTEINAELVLDCLLDTIEEIADIVREENQC
ncbi:MAG: hypothetical protein IJ272_08075 [Clostridia bacterium]|nr:hypothetical protein [Clostridia bacterium]